MGEQLMNKNWQLYPIVLFAVAVGLIIVGSDVGLWWMPCAVGILLGFLIPTVRLRFVLTVCSCLLGWSMLLLYQAMHMPIGDVAGVVANVTGLGSGSIIFLITGLLAVLLGLSGMWLGSTVQIWFGT